MPTLLEKIEASAAERLRIPVGRRPSEELPRYKDFLKVETHRLKIMHRAGGAGLDVCHGLSAVIDVLLKWILEAIEANLSEQYPRAKSWALVATGGYGRQELNPHSDVDIMFLHNGDLVQGNKPTKYLEALTDGLLYTLWDLGLKVGHAVRSINDCVYVANDSRDMQCKTALIESRLIKGDSKLVERFQKTLISKCVKGHEDAYIAARLRDQEARRAKFGNTFSLQEPNIKNCCGGLRDYQNLLWMSYFKYRTRTLVELEQRTLISRGERRKLEAAYEYLLRTRNELHYQIKRPSDTLLRNLQPEIALQLGYEHESPRIRLEKFMGKLYSHLRNVYLITRTLEQRLALLPQPTRLPTFREIIQSHRDRAQQIKHDGFLIIRDEIHQGSARVFKEQPRRMMRLFLHIQRRHLRLHPELQQLVRDQLSLVDRSFLSDTHVHDTFLAILSQSGEVARTLRTMHEVGFLGKYLPEFGKMTCRVQHEFYHQYTVDEHTLVCLEKLDAIWDASTPPLSEYKELFQDLERPHLLYLALLLHDSGKSSDGTNHEEVSARLATRAGKRLGLSTHSLNILTKVIRHHLSMAQISQLRDIDDPAVVRKFTDLINTPEQLRMLTVHTLVDSLGTSDSLWNGFKDDLLRTLFRRGMQLLLGEKESRQAGHGLKDGLLREMRVMLPNSVHQEEIEAHFETLPDRYFVVFTPREIAADIARAHRFMHLQLREDDRALEPIVDWHNQPDRGYTTMNVCTWDRDGLFAKIAGSLTAAGLSIHAAQIFTRQDGIIFDSFLVTDTRTGKMVHRKEREAFEALLYKALTQEANLDALIAHNKTAVSPYEPLHGDRLITQIQFDNNASDRCTVIDVETEDRVGILYAISHALSEASCDISLAKIVTGKGEAVDSFYINGIEGEKITDPRDQEQIRQGILAAIEKLEERANSAA